jgi:tetratricopeptide (TPR) repeat protein
MNVRGVRFLCAMLASAGVMSAVQAAQPAAPAAVHGAARADSKAPGAIGAAYRAADRAFQDGDYPLARDLTLQLTATFPTDAVVWLRLGEIEHRLGLFAQALAAYDRAIECETANPSEGGVRMAAIRYHRARLLVGEAGKDLAASGSVPLAEPLDASREVMRRALDQARASDPLMPVVVKAGARDARPAKGYVIDTNKEARENLR